MELLSVVSKINGLGLLEVVHVFGVWRKALCRFKLILFLS